MVHPQLQVYRSHILVLWVEESACWASWTDGNSSWIQGRYREFSVHTYQCVLIARILNQITSLLLSAPIFFFLIWAHTSKGHTFFHTHADIFIIHIKQEAMNSSPWMSPTLSLSPWAWVIVRPCEIIVAFNANGSPAHSLFSPGNRVLQSVKGPMSYCSAWTNLRLWGKWQKPAALSPLSPSLHVSFASLCPSAQADRHHTDKPRLYHSCGVVRRPVMGVPCGCGQDDRRPGLSCVTAALDHGQPWLVEKGFACVTALLGLLWDLRGKQREECGRSRGAQRFADLKITHGKKQIGLIWEHARTCARGKGYREPRCRRLSH